MMSQEERRKLRNEKLALVREYLLRSESETLRKVCFFTLGWLSGEPVYGDYLDVLLEHFTSKVWPVIESQKKGG